MANVKVISFLQFKFVCIFTKLNNFKHSRNFVRRSSRGGGLQRGAWECVVSSPERSQAKLRPPAVLKSSVCLSICLSVTHWLCQNDSSSDHAVFIGV